MAADETTPTLTPFTPADAAAVLALNQANVPEVGPLDERRLLALAAQADDFALQNLDLALLQVLSLPGACVRRGDCGDSDRSTGSDRSGRFDLRARCERKSGWKRLARRKGSKCRAGELVGRKPDGSHEHGRKRP